MTVLLDWRWWQAPRARIAHYASTDTYTPQTTEPRRTVCGQRITPLWSSTHRRDLPPTICPRCERALP